MPNRLQSARTRTDIRDNRKLNDAQKWYINPIVPTEINDKKRQIPNIEEAQRLGIDKLAETLNVDPEEIGSPTKLT